METGSPSTYPIWQSGEKVEGVFVEFWIKKGGVELGYLIHKEWDLPFLPRVGDTIGLDTWILEDIEDIPKNFIGTLYKITSFCWWPNAKTVTIDCESE